MRSPLLTVFLLGCLSCSGSRETVQGDPPVASVEYNQHWVTIRPTPNATAESLLDTAIFGPFRPGMTFGDALAIAGEPTNRVVKEHSTYYEYSLPTGLVAVGLSESSQGAGLDTLWTVTAYPQNRTLSSLLVPAAAKHLRDSPGKTVVQLMSHGNRVAIAALAEGSLVRHVIWFP
jgi:hypothetical protein